MIEDWININNKEDFKKIGNFNYVRKMIKEDISKFSKDNSISGVDLSKILNITSNSTSGLIKKIVLLKTFIEKNSENTIISEQENITLNKYFKSEAHEIIFYLNELDGEERLNKLSVYKIHYLNEELARKWYLDIAKKIHPDVLIKDNINGAEEAMSNLTAIYNGMRSNGK